MTWFVLLVIYAAFILVFFAVKLNRDRVVESVRPVEGAIEAIDFYWRPG